MAPPKHKRPSFNEAVRDLKKQPAAAEEAEDWREKQPNWAFSRCDLRGCRWSWEHVNGETLVQIIDRLKGHESLAWKQILLEKSNGSIEISHPKIDGDAKQRLVDLGLGNFDAIWKLRVDGPGRVWGVRKGRTFHIVWWDPEHTVYPLNIANH